MAFVRCAASMEEIVGRRRVVAYVALREDLIWALDEDGQRALWSSPRGSRRGPRRLAVAQAEVHRLRGHRILPGCMATPRPPPSPSCSRVTETRWTATSSSRCGDLSLAYAGRVAEAVAEGLRAEAEQPEEQNSQTSYVRYVVARVHVLAGQPEAALDRLETLVDEPGLRARELLRIDPNFAPIRTHPRFLRLLAGPGASDSASG